MHQGIESVHQGVLRWFSDLASAENSVKKRTQFFSHHKTGTRSSKFVFYAVAQIKIIAIAVHRKKIKIHRIV